MVANSRCGFMIRAAIFRSDGMAEFLQRLISSADSEKKATSLPDTSADKNKKTNIDTTRGNIVSV